MSKEEQRSVLTSVGLILPGDSEMRPGDLMTWRGRVYEVETVYPSKVASPTVVSAVQGVLDFESLDSPSDSPTQEG